MAEGNWENPHAISFLNLLEQSGVTGYIFLYRCGNIVYISCTNGSYTSQGFSTPLFSNEENITVPNLPVGYRPVENCQINDAYNKKRIVVAVSGMISSSDTFSNTYLRFSATWITSDPMPSA